MPHTISPDPSSQGLGISFSTLSPPPAEPSIPRFTGIVPQPQPTSSSPSRLPLAGQYQPAYRPQPSPTRAGPSSIQPSFQLRPTHTRHGSTSSSRQGYATFSAIPASPARPMGPRSASIKSPVLGGPSSSTVGSISGHNQIPSLGIDPAYADEEVEDNEEEEEEEAIMNDQEDDTPKQSLRPLPTPTRSASIASRLTTASNQISEDMKRKFSKSSGAETFGNGGGTGKYFPLSGEDDMVNEQELESDYGHTMGPSSTNVEASPMNQNTSHPRRSSTRLTNNDSVASGSEFISSGSMQASPSKMSNQSHQSYGSDRSYSNAQARQFPYPPASNQHPPRSATAYSDPTHHIAHPYNNNNQYQPYSQQYQIQDPGLNRRMTRSKSQPQYLYAVPELDDLGLSKPPKSMPNPDSNTMAKRSSNVSSGIHSKNAVLLSAENGGMMLAFSPTGDGTFRPGELICGSGTGLLPSSVQSPPSSSSSNDHSNQSHSQDELRARPWSDSTMSDIQHDTVLARKPTMLGQRGRSLSDGAQLLARQGTLLHPSSSKQRSSQELNVLLGSQKSRRLSSNKLLPPPPSEEDNKTNSWQKDNKVRLEASKKGKARVEVDVVLERECVVEGGEVRGRMEVRITGGKRGEGLRVGGGKVRVVGFEELSTATRHIFYHQPHPLPVFDPAIQHNLSSSLFASGPDSDGYRLASEGTHNIPFRMRLPLGGGAKGTYTSQNGKGPCVRYVVVGSVKIHIPSTGKRSIAHFYRSIVVLPYLNPSVVLAPSTEPVEGYVERGLGWNITGEKGRVELRVSLGRRIWVSGQRLWCEVAIRNDSNRKIKTLNLAILQTIQVFNPQPLLDTSDRSAGVARKRKSLPSCMDPTGFPGTPDLDACQTTTQRRKISEEIIEADFISQGAGRVTGKGWWTGVDSGENGHWDLSLQIPPGMLSIRRTRLIEVQYTLRVTVNGSIYVDVPVQLINFLSIDPPPMPRDGPRLLNPPVSNKQPLPHTQSRDLQVTIGGVGGIYQQPDITSNSASRPGAIRTSSEFSLDSTGGAARASSTTLHIDALLQAGRLRAEAEAMNNLPTDMSRHLKQPSNTSSNASSSINANVDSMGMLNVPSRPLSLGSSYSISRTDQNHLSNTHTRTKSNPLSLSQQTTLRPKGGRLMSYGSNTQQIDSQSIFSGETHELDEDESNENDNIQETEEKKIKLAALRARGRQKSLAAINRELYEEKRKYAQEDSPKSHLHTPLQGEFRPCHTPSEEVYDMNGNSSPEAESQFHRGSDLDLDLDLESPVEETERRQLRVVNADESDDEDENGNNEDEQHLVSRDQKDDDAYDGIEVTNNIQTEQVGEAFEDAEMDDAGNETVLADLIPEDREELEEVMSLHGGQGEEDVVSGNTYLYGEDEEFEGNSEYVHENTDKHHGSIGHHQGRISSSLSSQRLPILMHESENRVSGKRTVNGSFTSEQEVEVGQVYEAVKRNVSIEIPSRLLPLPSNSSNEDHEEAGEASDTSPVKDNLQEEVDGELVQTPNLPKSSSVSHSLLADARRNSQLQSETRTRTNSQSSMKTPSFSPGSMSPRRGSSMIPASTSILMSRIDSSTNGTTGHNNVNVNVNTSASPLRRQASSNSLSKSLSTSPIKTSNTVIAIQKKNSFTFVTDPNSPRTARNNLPISPGLSPKSFAVPNSSSDLIRVPSLYTSSSQLRNQIVPSPSNSNETNSNSHYIDNKLDEESRETQISHGSHHNHSSNEIEENDHDNNNSSGDENGLPGLAPSIASDSASSEGHQLESPISMTGQSKFSPNLITSTLNQIDGGNRSLPTIPDNHDSKKNNNNYQPFSVEEYHQQKQMINNQDWRSSNEYIRPNQQIYQVQTHNTQANMINMPHPTENREILLPIPGSTDGHDTNYDHDRSTPSSPTSSCHSILPSVKSKILQLENRDEALRKFSVSGSISSSVVPSRQPSIVTPMIMSSPSDYQTRQNSIINSSNIMSINQSRQGSIINANYNHPSLMAIDRSRNNSIGLTTINERLNNLMINQNVNQNQNQDQKVTSPTQQQYHQQDSPKRKSYTTALAPKPTPKRSTSDDSYYSSSNHNHHIPENSSLSSSSTKNTPTPTDYRYDQRSRPLISQSQPMNEKPSNSSSIGNGIGHTTYINRRSYASNQGGGGGNNGAYQPDSLNSRISISSNSTNRNGNNVSRLDPFGLGFGSGLGLANDGDEENTELKRNESIKSNYTSITEIESALNHISNELAPPLPTHIPISMQGNTKGYKLESLKEEISHNNQGQGHIIKPKTSGFWNNIEDVNVVNPKTFNNYQSPREMRVRLSESETSESEGLL
ncbi:uncharacterized protein L201_000877 [Kwoniella dendrophila CBS 6074]|uniref:Arrestin C-terminal-like domain-containing protein n=1 Tax=Kwoniella dendrophila CBS 6074 TaxID=1295534 RepID=A0AAX4JKV1_9TREE